MFRWWRKRKTESRPPFEAFLIEQSLQDQSISLEDVLAKYIDRYDLTVRHALDEPKSITAARTRLQILEETTFADPELSPDPQMREYIEVLRMNVKMADGFDPDFLAAMKERERNR